MNKTVFIIFLFLIPQLLFSQKQYDLFYRPQNGYPGDFIPFYDKGEFRLFYLHDWRDKEKFGEGTPWYQISTKDFIHFTEYGEMLARGTKEEQDLYVYTGSVIKAEGMYHIFYTAHNPYFIKKGKAQELIAHAVSNDLIHWEKIAEDTLAAPKGLYEKDDWRDPFVFWNVDANEYWMLIATRIINDAPSVRRGCTALAVSKDLKKWEVKKEPFRFSGFTDIPECPDLFKIGDWWYLITSVFNRNFSTRYVMSKSLNGPWIIPANDTFDEKHFYAAKSYSDGNHRYLFGWNSTNAGRGDSRSYEWGGNLVVHELIQNEDGTLRVIVPETIDKAFKKELPVKLNAYEGSWKINGNKAETNSSVYYSTALADSMPSCCKISTTITFKKGTKECGIILRAQDKLDNNYYVRLEPENNRIVFEGERRAPFNPIFERPIQLKPDVPHKVKVFVDKTNCVIYVDDKVALTTRMYNLDDGRWGLFVLKGSANFSDTKISIME